MIVYSVANLSDVEKMQNMIKADIEDGIIIARKDDEVANQIRSYTLAIDDELNKIVGYCSLQIHTTKLAEVRSLIVDKGYRRLGIASRLIEEKLSEAKNLGIKKVLVLTYQQELFEKLGFVEIPKEEIPEQKIWADCIRCKSFPICKEVSLIKSI
jgi:amino-acid N-acetyltransferase